MPCAKKMRGCRISCGHRALVLAYREERQRQEIAAENDYRERDGNDQAPALITFKDWIIAHCTIERDVA